MYRGSPAAARNYVEADRSRVDDYYLAEGTGVAARYVARAEGVHSAGPMDGDTYERWVAGYQVGEGPDTGLAKGRLRTDDRANRFVEITVNGPKTWSLAAVVDPEIAAAYDRAQDRAAQEVIGWLAQHATTRVGPRGRQVQVPAEEIEAAVIRHYTSRAGDPHRHLHVQINARVFADGRWRGLHTVGVRDFLEAINGIGHAVVMTDPEFRALLALRGFQVDADSGEIAELRPFVGGFSARSRQIEQHLDRYEAEWRGAHPGQEPGPRLRQAWDRRAWAEERPDKVVPTSGAGLEDWWRDELAHVGFRRPTRPVPLETVRPGMLDRDAMTAEILTRLGARVSAWNAADARGAAERLIAALGVVVDGAVRRELAEDLTARAVNASTVLLDRDDIPEHVRSLSSPRVIAVENHLVRRFSERGNHGGKPTPVATQTGVPLDSEQHAAAAHLTGPARLVIVEGAAGAGKTMTLAAAGATMRAKRKRMLVVSPTLKGAKVAADQVGAASHSAAWLLHQHGYRWDDHGHWWFVDIIPAPAARLRKGDLLVVDEAGMLDQDTAVALLQVADKAGARLALIGDRHQLPAVGRGGVLDLAARYASAYVDLDGVRRFTDASYANLTLRMRNGKRPDAVFDELLAHGQVAIHPSEVERMTTLASLAADGTVVITDTREAAGRINTMAHHAMAPARRSVGDLITDGGERISVGDKIATRRNDPDADVANRETWTVLAINVRGLTVAGEAGRRHLPMSYARQAVELAYATTAYGIQGATVPTAHVLIGHHSSAASAYVAMTRGRNRNVAHLVAESLEDARQQWVDVFDRDRADLGPARSAQRAAEEIERFGPNGASRYVSSRRRASRPSRSIDHGVRIPSTRSPSRDGGLGL